MTTQPGDLVFDPTCGSGTTAYVAEQWGRRWVTCDTSRVSLNLAKQRLMTATFDYHRLARPEEGVDSGLLYRTAPHITSTTIAKNEPPMTETLYDQPLIDGAKTRVSGPFTFEAVPAPAVKSPDAADEGQDQPADESVARMGETQRQGDWRDELLKSGIRGRAGQRIQFSRVEALPGTRWLHADAETKEATPERVVVSFGPDHAPLEQRQIQVVIATTFGLGWGFGSVGTTAPAAMYLQYATDEPFLNGELAKQYFEIVSEPKKLKIYDAPHALSAEATRDRIAFLAEQLSFKPPDAKAMAAIPALVQPLWPRPPQ